MRGLSSEKKRYGKNQRNWNEVEEKKREEELEERENGKEGIEIEEKTL